MAALKHPRKPSLSLLTRKIPQLSRKHNMKSWFLFTSQFRALSGAERQGGFSRMWSGLFCWLFFYALVAVLWWHIWCLKKFLVWPHTLYYSHFTSFIMQNKCILCGYITRHLHYYFESLLKNTLSKTWGNDHYPDRPLGEMLADPLHYTPAFYESEGRKVNRTSLYMEGRCTIINRQGNT